MKHEFPNEVEVESCMLCNCAEGTLPIDCPGYEIPEDIQDEIYHGSLDFRDGEWQAKKDCVFLDPNDSDSRFFSPKLVKYYSDAKIRIIANKIIEDSCVFSKWLKETRSE